MDLSLRKENSGRGVGLEGEYLEVKKVFSKTIASNEAGGGQEHRGRRPPWRQLWLGPGPRRSVKDLGFDERGVENVKSTVARRGDQHSFHN